MEPQSHTQSVGPRRMSRNIYIYIFGGGGSALGLPEGINRLHRSARCVYSNCWCESAVVVVDICAVNRREAVGGLAMLLVLSRKNDFYRHWELLRILEEFVFSYLQVIRFHPVVFSSCRLITIKSGGRRILWFQWEGWGGWNGRYLKMANIHVFSTLLPC